MDPEELLDLAVAVATEAGALLLDRFRSDVGGVDTKSTPTDVVTEADRTSEDLVLNRLASTRPGDGVISEESEGRESESGLTWIVDPLDGTVNYLFGIPVWGVSIAVQDEQGPLAGVVIDPTRDEVFSTLRGGGSKLNGRPIRVTDADDLATSLVGTGFSYDSNTREMQAKRLVRVLPRVRDLRRAGSAAIDLAWLACGRLDGFFEAPMKVWDRAAGELLVSEAGGVVTPLEPPSGEDRGVVAAGPGLHGPLNDLVLAD
ncbi:MAG: inositol monophosphatase [Actinomycetota bacterium]|nr:inositol monophosphatase [Actinomycetota bacterium]